MYFSNQQQQKTISSAKKRCRTKMAPCVANSQLPIRCCWNRQREINGFQLIICGWNTTAVIIGRQKREVTHHRLVQLPIPFPIGTVCVSCTSQITQRIRILHMVSNGGKLKIPFPVHARIGCKRRDQLICKNSTVTQCWANNLWK